MGDQEERQVQLYVYDLSQGFASQISQAVLGKQVITLICVLKFELGAEMPHMYMVMFIAIPSPYPFWFYDVDRAS